MSDVTLHHVTFSRSFRVLWMLVELGLTPKVVPYSIRDGSLQAPDVLGRSPAGRVPALEIDGVTLFESGAILEYLAETRPEAGLGRAVGHPERIAYLQHMHYAETMASLIENLNLNHIFLRDPAMMSPLVVKITARRLAGTLRGLEAQLGSDGYLLAQGFSAADMMLGFNLFAAPYYVDFADFPKTSAYRDRLAERPGYQAARELDGEQLFYTKDFYPSPEMPA